MAEMFTSASDITSNPGNAALGYSGGVGYSANPADTNPGAPIQSVLGQIAQTEEKKRIAEKTRQQKEQDELASYLAGTGESVFNMKGPDGKPSGFTMLPQDREYVNERVNEIRNKVISEPGTYKFDADLKSKEQELKQLTDLAGIRATEVAKRKVLAASTNDMRERERILKSIEDIEKEPVYSFKTPSAYLPSPTWSFDGLGLSKDILSGKNKEATDILQVGTEKDADGNEIIISRPGIRASILDKRNEWRRGSKEFTEAENMVKAFYADPSATSFESIFQLNQDAAAFNKARGLKPGDANYVPPVGEVFPDSSVELPPINDTNIANIAYALLAQKAGQVGVGKEIKKTKSQLEKEQNEMNIAKGNLQINREYLELAKAKFEADKDKMTKEERIEGDRKINAMSDALGVYELISQPTTKALDKVINSVKEGERSGLNKIIQEMGGSAQDYNVRPLSVSDGTIVNIAAIRGYNQKGEPNKITTKPQYGYVVVPKNGDLSKARFVFSYKINKPMVDEETGEIAVNAKTKLPRMQEVVEWKALSPQEAIKSKSMASNNYDDKTAELIDRDARAENMLREMFSQGETLQPADVNPVPAYKVKGTETIGPTADSVPESDIKKVNGVDMVRYNGVWRKVVTLDDKNRLILE
jgi:hypothetical protein